MSARRRSGSERGSALVEALIAVAVLGLGGSAVIGTMLGAAAAGRGAARRGRGAELALRTADRLRAGLLAADSGTAEITVGGEAFEVTWAHRDEVSPGAIEVVVHPASEGADVRLGPARPLP